MLFIEENNQLKLVVDHDGEKDSLWDFHNDGSIETDASMYDFFEGILANCEWEWIDAEEIGALTSAPILGYRDENENVVEAYGFMSYCIESLLERLFISDEAILERG
jgi:hypothetical protein